LVRQNATTSGTESKPIWMRFLAVRVESRTDLNDTTIPTKSSFCCARGARKSDIEDDWMTLDDYVSKITGKRFSHGMCPGCAAKFVLTQ